MTSSEPVDYFGLQIPFMQYVGLRPEALDKDYCRTSLAITPELTNSRGDVHGGTIMAVLDFTLSAAARSHDPDNTGVSTIEMSTHFLEAVAGDIIIESRCLRRGRSIAFCEGTITSAATGDQVAVARATFKLLSRKPAA